VRSFNSCIFPANFTRIFSMTTRQSPKPAPTLRLKNILPAVGSLTRWRMLAELAKGEPLPASELARRGRLSLNAASKHLVLLHNAGLVDRGYGRLYRIPQQFFVAGELAVDFGAFVLRLDYADPERK
jgi:DNA-binding transcriptional ArsR family regulator